MSGVVVRGYPGSSKEAWEYVRESESSASPDGGGEVRTRVVGGKEGSRVRPRATGARSPNFYRL